MKPLSNPVVSMKQSCLKCRHVLTFLVFLGFFNVYTMRVNLSVAIVAMVNTTASSNLNGSNYDVCSSDEKQDNSTIKKEGEFPWSEYQQGVVLGCFFYSYTIINIVGGRFAEIIGVKWTYGFGILSTALLTILTPLAARWSYDAMIALRVLEGAMEALTFPAIHCMMGRWYSKGERSFNYSIMNSGAAFGSVVSMWVSGILCDSEFLGGWPAAFYVFGVIGLVWCAFWFFLMHEFPEDHPRITKEELDYIKNDLKSSVSKDKPLPWKEILTSIPVLACAFSALAKNWGFCIITYNIPTYLKNILAYDIGKSGLLSALPNIMDFLVIIVSGYISDWILSKNVIGVTATRKLINTLGLLPSVVCLLLITFSGCNRTIIVTCLILSLGASGLCTSGYMTAIVDMSPTYSGTVMGLVNGFSQISGILAPYTVGVMTDHNQTIHQWHKIFYISSGISAFAMLSFAIFGSSELQSWSKEDSSTNTENTSNTIKGGK